MSDQSQPNTLGVNTLNTRLGVCKLSKPFSANIRYCHQFPCTLLYFVNLCTEYNKTCLGDNYFMQVCINLFTTSHSAIANWWQLQLDKILEIFTHYYPEETRKKNLVPEKYWIFFSTTFLYFLTVQSYKTLYRHYFAEQNLVK